MNSAVITLCATLLILAGQALGAPAWPNEPAGSTPIVDYTFNTIETSGGQRPGIMWGNYGSGRITSDPTAPLSPSNVMVSSLSAGAKIGGSEVHYFTPNYKVYRELYVGLWWRTNPEFQGRTVGNKLFFIRGPNSNAVFNFNDGALSSGTGKMIWGANASGIDNSHACSYQFGATCYPNISGGILRTGKWTRLEAYVKASTTTTSRDGIVRWWIDGVLAGNYTNINNAPDGYNEWMWTETWDGCGGNANCDLGVVNTANWAHYVDHLYVSAPNCGAAGCPAPPYLVITSSLSSARAGVPYTATLSADGGTKPYTWFVESGRLPAGLTLNSNTGVISGSPTCIGRSDFTIRVMDMSSPALSTTKAYSMVTSGTGATCTANLSMNAEHAGEFLAFSAKASGHRVSFHFPATGGIQGHLSIYDLAGKKVYDQALTGKRAAGLEIFLKNGIYIARLEKGIQTNVVRFNVVN